MGQAFKHRQTVALISSQSDFGKYYDLIVRGN